MIAHKFRSGPARPTLRLDADCLAIVSERVTNATAGGLIYILMGRKSEPPGNRELGMMAPEPLFLHFPAKRLRHYPTY
jgi:hypothetical protein